MEDQERSGGRASVVALAAFTDRTTTQLTCFDRRELDLILRVYGRKVADGEWRDYAIDQIGGAAIFSVFRHTHDAPLYAIAKQGGGGKVEYVVFSGREKLRRAKTLGDALKVFTKRLRVVS